MKIEFVSDVACPWCAIGLNALERALGAVAHPPADRPADRVAGGGHQHCRPEQLGVELEQAEHRRLAAHRQQRGGDEGDDEDGTYVGRTGSDDAIDDEQSGAEARAQQRGN